MLVSSISLLPLPKPPRSLTKAKPLILLLGYPTSMTQMMGAVLFCLGGVLSLCSVVCCLACTTYLVSLLPTALCTLVLAENLPCVSESASWHIQTGKEGSCSYGFHWSEVRKCCKWPFTSRFCSHLPLSWAKDQAGLLWKNTAFHCICVCGRKSVVEKLMFLKSQVFITFLTFLQGKFFCVHFPNGKQHPSSQALEQLPWQSPCS